MRRKFIPEVVYNHIRTIEKRDKIQQEKNKAMLDAGVRTEFKLNNPIKVTINEMHMVLDTKVQLTDEEDEYFVYYTGMSTVMGVENTCQVSGIALGKQL